ncbi:hypothetical protein D3C86_1649660 [compost metagenome]
MAVAPVDQGQHGGIEVAALVAQAVLLAYWPLLIGDLVQHPGFDQFLQAFGQHMAGHAQALFELVETPDAEKTFAQHQQGPAVADYRQGAGQGTGLLLEFFPTHCTASNQEWLTIA